MEGSLVGIEQGTHTCQVWQCMLSYSVGYKDELYLILQGSKDFQKMAKDLLCNLVLDFYASQLRQSSKVTE